MTNRQQEQEAVRSADPASRTKGEPVRPLKSVMQRIARISLFSIHALLFVGPRYSIHPALEVFATSSWRSYGSTEDDERGE